MKPFYAIGSGILAEIADLFRSDRITVIGGTQSFEIALPSLNAVFDHLDLVDDSARTRDPKIIADQISRSTTLLIGLGGCSRLDVLKLVAHIRRIPLITYPTLVGTDGVASKFASMLDCRGDPVSIPTKFLQGIVIDRDLVQNSGERFIRSAIADVCSNITAAHTAPNRRSRDDATHAAMLLLEQSKPSLDLVLETVVRSGLSVSEDQTTQAISGFEHNMIHAMHQLRLGTEMTHGEQAAITTIITAALQNQDWQRLQTFLHRQGLDTTIEHCGITRPEMRRILHRAAQIRPERLCSTTLAATLDEERINRCLTEIEQFDQSL